jgi:hypothetical protein
MKVLVGFEESGIVTAAFRARGHKAWSCDILPTRGNPDWHLQGDIERALNLHSWDLWILHPPCTATCVSGNGTYADTRERSEACERVKNLIERDGPARCIEQPVSVVPRFTGHKPTQYIQPWMFGHGETKKTALYLRGLEPLRPTDIVEGCEGRIWKMAPGENRSRARSETFRGIAEAMADQWGK